MATKKSTTGKQKAKKLGKRPVTQSDGPPLTQTEWRFAVEYSRDGNGQAAYLRMRPECTPQAAGVSASRLLKKASVQQAIADLRKRVEDRAIIDRSWVLDTLVKNVQRSLQESPVCDSQGNPTGEYQYKPSAVNRGCELIGKELGMFLDKQPSSGRPMNVVVMNDDQKRSALQAIFGSLGVASSPADHGRQPDGTGLVVGGPDPDHVQGGDDAGPDAEASPLFDG